MSNLLEKASILTTPTAYNDGKLLSVKPVPYLGSELVTNGDFSNGSADWSVGSNSEITNGSARIYSPSGGYTFVSQSNVLTIGKTYLISLEIVEQNLGEIRLSDGSGYLSNSFSGVGVHTFKSTSTGTILRIQRTASITDISIDNVSVKEVINGDFDFTRNSSATRVASNGLIEDVQILSGNLVTNGDFSQEGAELVTNGDFASDSDWIKASNWTISGGSANADGSSGGQLSQTTDTVVIGKTYKIEYTILNYVSGSFRFSYAGTSESFNTSNGTYTTYRVATNAVNALASSSINFIGSIDNVSVKEVGQGWTVYNGNITDKYNASMTSYQSGIRITPFSKTGKFKVTFDLVVTSGNCKFDAGGANNQTYTTSGAKEIIVTNPTKFEFNAFNLGWVGTLDNISVIEITDDTNLPRIDYTDGVGHILLEPQSTNKATYSEDFSQWTKAGGVSVEIGYSAPDGSNNAYKISGTSSSSLYLASITNTTDTRTIWARTLSGSGDVYLCGNLNDTNALFTVNSQWQRFELNGFVGGGATTFYAVDFRGSSTLTELIIWGAQAEALPYATSYIPTSGSTVTRLGETLNNSGSSDLINSTEGVIYAEVSALANDGINRYVTLSDGTFTNAIKFRYTTSPNEVQFEVTVGGVRQASFYATITNALENNKFAMCWKLNQFKFFINGVQSGSTDTSGIVFPINTLNKINFDNSQNASHFYGNVKCVAVFKEALTDAELTCLTTI